VASRWATEELPVITRFEVRRRNYLAPDGSTNRPLPAFAADAKLLVGLYRAMVMLRPFLTERLLHCSAKALVAFLKTLSDGFVASAR
jgi:hypothetical protein